MKKILLSSLLLSLSLFATDGYKVYENKCKACHVEVMSKEHALKHFKELVAPPMVEVSQRLKENIKTTDEEEDVDRYLFILFVKDYIVNPNLDNSMCNTGAIETFGTMPSLKGQINEDEKQAVAEWLYDRYEDTKF
ncbi:c-type cytochrome [Sulfurimonas sp. SAG-AH-194-L11]|nr:c-type cytochrome [Sulfurimonas sp. SAG-AH-194-L11]MDF1877168.1 c-type cytochrome [Sulfurimonas sp. SAG-AH-194-L11]